MTANIDYLRILLDRAEELEPPTLDVVRYYVRSGISMPSKRYMLENDVVMVSWDFPFADRTEDGQDFGSVVLHREQDVAPTLKQLSTFLGGPKGSETNGGDVPSDPIMFHGIFPVRSASGAVSPSRYRVLWSGRREAVSILEDWKVGAMRPCPDAGVLDSQRKMRDFINDLLAYVDTSYGDGLHVMVLDPRLGANA
jgi:hypothetical protein